ncbi:MAG: hypothetical protein IBX68_00510 [Dehalococcoidia bacterium]|nr:hypothetical protein [Dehalococcoidia bacterium]
MLRRLHKVLETPGGTGEILQNGKRIAKVEYDLSIEVERILATSFVGDKASLARKFISGKISVLEGNVQAAEGASGALALVLDDGRTFPFKITGYTVASNGPYEILGAIKHS